MEVAVSALRADLARWIGRVRAGEQVVVTERGAPVARLVPIDVAPVLEQLVRDGIIAPPQSTERPVARDFERVHATGSVSDLVSELRDQRR